MEMSGVVCEEFDADVFDQTLDVVVGNNATFSDATCTDDDTNVDIETEVSVPLKVVQLYDDASSSVLSHVSTVLDEAVSSGLFTETLRVSWRTPSFRPSELDPCSSPPRSPSRSAAALPKAIATSAVWA